MAAAAGTSLEACLNLIRPLERLVGANSPSMIREMLAVPNALMSPQNTAGLEEPTVISRDGKTLVAQLDYFEPNLTAQVGAVPDFCALNPAEAGTPKKTLDLTLTKEVYRNGKVGAENYRALCEGPMEVMSYEILNAAYECVKEMSAELYTAMAATCGTYVSGVNSATTPKTINLISATGDLNSAAALGIKREFDRHGITPLVIGGRTIKSATDMQMITSKQGGVSFEPDLWSFGMPIWADFKVDETLDTLAAGNSYALAWAPGAFRLLTGVKNVGVYEELADSRVTKTTTNIMGIPFDIWTKYDPECSLYIWQIAINFDLVAVPEASYVAGQNFNSKLQFLTGIGAWTAAEWTT